MVRPGVRWAASQRGTASSNAGGWLVMSLPMANMAPPMSTKETSSCAATSHGWATGTMRVGPSCGAASGARPSDRGRAPRPASARQCPNACAVIPSQATPSSQPPATSEG